MLLQLILLFAVFGPICPLSVPDTSETLNDDEIPETIPEKKPEMPFSTHYLNSLDHKIETMMTTLSSLDTSVKQLQEKAHTWAIFKHHIDSWNDQMKVLEHKIDLIRRTQDENQMISQKLTSQEFTLNHILSKVVYLSDSCNSGGVENFMIRLREDGFGELKKLINADRKIRNEIGTRLSNILRHVQNIETDNCRSFKHTAGDGTAGSNKMAKLMLPIRTCNNSCSNDNIEMSLKVIDEKINKMIGTVPQKDIKQIMANEQRNTKKLEDILDYLEKIDDRTVRLYHAEEENRSKLSDLCQSMSTEVTTFTGSSDLLLKKNEKLVRDVQAKVERLIEKGCVEEKHSQEEVNPEGLPPPTNGDDNINENGTETNKPEEDDSGENKVDDNNRNDANGNTDDVEEIDNESSESQDPVEEVNFVQPTKIGCHELNTRVDGIYKFSTPELNEAGRDINERYCAFATDGSAWTVIQNRGPYVIQENFNRSWNEYRDGFGGLEKDFWFGNEFIHQLSYIDNYELRIELEDFDEVKAWVEYNTFRIDTEKYNYNLIIGGYRGAIPDAMGYHNEQDFSTYDRRNDKSVDACCACATGYASGWWFDNCSEANLNGVFHDTPLGHNYVGIVWDQWHGDYSLKSSKMMIRPKVWPAEEEHEVPNGSSEDP